MEKKIAELQWNKARKREIDILVVFCGEPNVIETLEGAVRCLAGDAILYGVHGEQWPVRRELFEMMYKPVFPVKMGNNGLYRRLPYDVDAAQLTQRCTIPLPENRGYISGNEGDWLVKLQDDSYGIVAEDIFPKTYDIIE